MGLEEVEATRPGPSDIEAKSGPDAVAALSARFAALSAEPDESQEDETQEVELQEVDEEESSGEEIRVEESTEEVSESEEEDVDQSGESEGSFSTLSELLEAGGVDSSDLSVTVKVAGEDREITLEEAVRGYQRQADYDRHMTEIRQARSEIEEIRENIFEDEGVKQKLGAFEEAFQIAEMVIHSDAMSAQKRYDSVDWQELRANDREEYAALQADFQREARELSSRQEGLRNAYQEAKQVQTEEQAKRFRKVQATERRNLIERGWPEDQLKERLNDVYGYLHNTYGASEQELQRLIDHRIVDVARKAMLYDQAADVGKKVVGGKKKVTRTLKPGSSVGNLTKRKLAKARDEDRERLSKSHRAEDAVTVMKNRLRRST
jgi:hypothetical protein